MSFSHLLKFYYDYKDKGIGDELKGIFKERGPLIISVIFFGSVAAFIIMLIIFINENKNQIGSFGTHDVEKDDKVCVKVKVVDKISKLSRSDPHNYIVFERENGERLKFLIWDNNKYATIVIGDEGLLTYAEQAFYDFTRIN